MKIKCIIISLFCSSMLSCNKVNNLSPVLKKTIVITPDQVHNGYSVPVDLVVPNSVSSTPMLVHAVLDMKFNGIAYTGSDDLKICYQGTPDKIVGYLSNAISSENDFKGDFSVQSSPMSEGDKLVLYVRDSPAKDGNSTLLLTVYYRNHFF